MDVETNQSGLTDGRVDVVEREAWTMPGAIGMLATIVLLAGSVLLVVLTATNDGNDLAAVFGVGSLVAILLFSLAITSVKIVAPGDTRVLLFFGKYVGTVRKSGLHTVRPLTSAKKISVKVCNFETNELKVNDSDGNPINIAAVVVWRVADTAKAMFAVDEYEDFVKTQSESALRHVANSHPYDNASPGEESLRGSTDLVSQELAAEVAARIAIAGLEVVEARIASLAYAPEIAHAMLQRQQAAAVIAAREKIVDGAVSMVESALRQLEADDVVKLDEERKAAMVSNLLVVLCGSSQATPVVNAGSLYT